MSALGFPLTYKIWGRFLIVFIWVFVVVYSPTWSWLRQEIPFMRIFPLTFKLRVYTFHLLALPWGPHFDSMAELIKYGKSSKTAFIKLTTILRK